MEFVEGPVSPLLGGGALIWSKGLCPAGDYASWWSVMIAARHQRSVKTRIDKTVEGPPGAVRDRSEVASYSLATLSLPSLPTRLEVAEGLLLGPRIQVDMRCRVVRTDARDPVDPQATSEPGLGTLLPLSMDGLQVSASLERDSAGPSAGSTPSSGVPTWKLTLDSDPRLGLSGSRSIHIVISGFELREPPTEWLTVPVEVLVAHRSEIF